MNGGAIYPLRDMKSDSFDTKVAVEAIEVVSYEKVSTFGLVRSVLA